MYPFYLLRQGCESHSQHVYSPKPDSYLIHPFNKKLPVCREDEKLFLMNLGKNNGCLR